MNDAFFMKIAIQEAYKGVGKVAPNPLVGCVIVNDGKVIARGHHEFFGGRHAEVMAITGRDAINRVSTSNATMYVTLQPCSHHGKTPPCTDQILRSGMRRVVIGRTDPWQDPRGIDILRQAGITVETIHESSLQKECQYLARYFFTYQTYKRPHIILKYATSKEGYITFQKNTQTSLTNITSQKRSHALRAEVDGIVIGANTKRIDNPKLTCRYVSGTDPEKIILGRDYLCPRSMDDFLGQMIDRGIYSLLIEGGNMIWKWFLDHGVVDEIWHFEADMRADMPKDPVVAEVIFDTDMYHLWKQEDLQQDTLKVWWRDSDQ